jgi:hypothetical protein
MEANMRSDGFWILVRRHAVLVATVGLLLGAVTGCVSVQKSGNQAAADSPPLPSASVMFDSRPDPAEVYINGEFRGTTPVKLVLAEGTHTVEYRLVGYQPWSRDLVVVAGEDTRVAATLLPD